MDTNEKVFYKTFIIIVIILAVFISFFIFSIIRYQRKNMALHRKNLQSEIEALENERTRIANDLHDELGPLLAAIKLNVTSVETISEEDTFVLEKAAVHLDVIIQRLREIAANLMPATLIKNGFPRALEQYVNAISQNRAVKIKTFIENDLKMSKETEINFYRICLEIIHNTLRHSKAQNLVIEVTRNSSNILLLSKDDGIGFDIKNMSDKRFGLGIKNIISRTEAMGGACSFNSELSKGLQIVIEIPIT